MVQSTRAGSGRTFAGTKATKNCFLIVDNLNPQKAHLLLALALTVTSDPAEIWRILWHTEGIFHGSDIRGNFGALL